MLVNLKALVSRGLKILCVAVISAAVFIADAHPSANLHYKDIDLFLGGFKNTELGKIAYDLSSSMDNELLEWFKHEYGWPPGNHRMFSHSYTLGDAIPRESLKRIEEEYGKEAVEKVIEKQQEIAGRFLERIMNATGLPRKQARALMRQISNCHLLGDLMKDNSKKYSEIVKSFDSICEGEIQIVKDLFGRTNPDYAAKLIKEIKALKKSGLSVADKAEKLTQMFGKFKMDAALNKYYGNVFKEAKKPLQYSSDQAIARNAKLIERIKNGIKPTLAAPKFLKCNLREVKVGGKVLKVVDLPVVTKNGVTEAAEVVAKRSAQDAAAVRAAFAATKKTAIKAGTKVVAKAGTKVAAKEVVNDFVKKGGGEIAEFLKTPRGEGLIAGVLTFVVDEYTAVAEYSEGNLARDQFVQKTIFNSGKGAVTGLATIGIAAAATGVGLPIAMALTAEIAVCIVIDKGGEYIWAEYEKGHGVLAGVTDDELLYTLPPCVRNRALWVGELDETKMESQRQNNKRIFDSNAPTDFEQTGRSFY